MILKTAATTVREVADPAVALVELESDSDAATLVSGMWRLQRTWSA